MFGLERFAYDRSVVFIEMLIHLITGLLAEILKENNILQVQINAEHLRKRYKRVLYRKEKNAYGHNKRISSYFETFQRSVNHIKAF